VVDAQRGAREVAGVDEEHRGQRDRQRGHRRGG